MKKKTEEEQEDEEKVTSFSAIKKKVDSVCRKAKVSLPLQSNNTKQLRMEIKVIQVQARNGDLNRSRGKNKVPQSHNTFLFNSIYKDILGS